MSAANTARSLSDLGNGSLLMSVRHINAGIVIRPRSPDVAAPDAEPMTGREREVLSLVAEGFSNKLVAAELGIGERTVKNRLTSIMMKLRAADRTHAVVAAVRPGWLAI